MKIPRIALFVGRSFFLLSRCRAAPGRAEPAKPVQDVAPDDAGQECDRDTRASEPVRAPHGMVVTVHHLATDAGVAHPAAGGNAVDAAVAMGFALAVVHPVAGNLGGGGFMLRHARRTNVFIDYREKAPLAATQNMYLDAQGNMIPNASVLGLSRHWRAGIGCGPCLRGEEIRQAAWLKKVMEPAIALASDGFVLSDEEAGELARHGPDRVSGLETHLSARWRFLQGRRAFRQPELAETLERIANDPGRFYHGKMAEQLAEPSRRAAG